MKESCLAMSRRGIEARATLGHLQDAAPAAIADPSGVKGKRGGVGPSKGSAPHLSPERILLPGRGVP